MIRGGAEYDLGIYITGVDQGSAAEFGGLKVLLYFESFTQLILHVNVATFRIGFIFVGIPEQKKFCVHIFGIVPDNICDTGHSHCDVPSHQEHACKPHYCEAILHLIWVLFSKDIVRD